MSVTVKTIREIISSDKIKIWPLDGYLHISRSLLIAAVCLGFFGVMIALVGMKCTKIGGSDKTKSKIAFFAGLNFLVSGLCSLAGYSVYAHQVMSEFFYPSFRELKFELGSALFIGWSGSSLSIVGGLVFCFPLIYSICTSQEEYSYTGTNPLSTSYTKHNYKHNHFRKATPDYSSTSLQFGKNAYV
ncbi:claudin-10-like [Scleropages formosus]|uniref:Claudin-10-like n=1 Tax=Scleropages formosus TaxID=113540 RepID=A0A0P7XUF7_SCLFO|nr:claudin-10-like [Scleropages formosus]